MTETLITFETAKLAKEKGIPQSENPSYLLCDYTECNVFHENPYNLNIGNLIGFYIPEKTINALTQSLLQKYLREVHNIEIIVHPKEHSSLGFMYVVDVFFIDQLNNISYSGVYSLYKTYEEALETGLQEAIKLIK